MMEVSLQMNSKTTKMILMKSSSLMKIACRASQLSVPRKRANFYEILSLGSENVGFDEIKKAYRNMAKRYHPDVCPPSAKEESTKRFVELREAYETLSDPILRRLYDYELRLVSSSGFGVEGFGMDERESRFPRDVWENQLHGLRQRSGLRMARMRNIR